MASTSTVTLERVVNYASLFVRQAPLAINPSNDPALSMGDWVRGFILSPPFAWRWNRGTLSFNLVQGQQDYAQNLATGLIPSNSQFGWLEMATIIDPGGVVHALENKLNLHEESIQNRPAFISARLDDGNQNITFRISPIPDQAYVLNISFQQAAIKFANLSDLWQPIPDYLSYIYQQGFLAKTYEYLLDERMQSGMQLFAQQLVQANGGLDRSETEIFLAAFRREIQARVE